MSRWALPILLLFCACLFIYGHRSDGPGLLTDSDTAVALRAIEARHNALSWFVTDWPLENHFYRPLPTLSLSADLALHGHDSAGFGQTNALLCIFGVLALFWFAYELTESPGLAGASVTLFTAWLTVGAGTPSLLIKWLGIIVLLYGAIRWREKWRIYVPTAFLVYYLGSEINGLGPGLSLAADIGARTIGWVPGRTATIMTIFAMVSLASYARFERLSAPRDAAKEPEPLDLPATRTTVLHAKRGIQWPWAVLAFVSAVLAFASYEQAVMVPATLLGVAVLLRSRGLRVRWWLHGLSWALIPGYLLLRHAIMPSTISRYQGQQLRFSISVFNDLLECLAPGAAPIQILWARLDMGLAILFDASIYITLLFFAANVFSYWKARKRWQNTLGCLILAFLSYMPMAWLKYFGHYLYWPVMFRSLYVVSLAWLAAESLVNVVSHQALQAPKRLHPAPGSLPHR